jgi:DNA-binding MarR family transcriptional regulator
MNKSAIVALPCMCGTLRRASRALTQFYEEAMRPAGLRSSQFTILQALSLGGEMTQGKLAEILAMDSTTLTRTLPIMRRHGWIAERRGDDRRERWLRLTKSGEAQLKRALPLWEETQARLRRQLGEEVWQDLLRLNNQITNTLTNQLGGSI